MTLDQTQQILFLVLAIAAAWVTFFMCWLLYEIAMLIRRTNAIVRETQQKIAMIEKVAANFKEKFVNPLSALSFLAGGGKALYSYFSHKKGKKGKR